MIRLPWRWHAHLHIHVRARLLDPLFDAVIEAAHKLDEPVTITGSLRGWPIAHLEVTAHGMRRRAVDALADRVRDAVGRTPASERLVRVKRRCRCS